MLPSKSDAWAFDTIRIAVTLDLPGFQLSDFPFIGRYVDGGFYSMYHRVLYMLVVSGGDGEPVSDPVII